MVELSLTKPPAQNVVGPFGEMNGVAVELTLTAVGAEFAPQPAASIT